MQARINQNPYQENPGEVKELAERFAQEMHKELGILVKSIVWFGSFTRTRFTAGKKPIINKDEVMFSSDIDILIVFDDMINVLNPEVITAYRVITENVASKISKRLHITTMQLTKFWDYLYKGDPILINMLRDGVPVYDTGTFGMAQKMLSSKLIKPTGEIVQIYLHNGPISLATAKWNLRQAVLDLYWAVVDAAHAALVKRNVAPDHPEQIIELFDVHIVKPRVMEKKYLVTLAEFNNVGKMILRGELHKVSGDHYDRYKKEAEEFINAVKEVLYTK